MAINKNHEFEEINGIKCSIVEKNASPERVAFLKELLEWNGFTVVTAPSPAAKPVAPKPPVVSAEAGELVPEQAAPPPPETFTIGVTHVAFNPTNAIFGRLLKSRDGHIVTLTYWYQESAVSRDDKPYFE